MTSWHSSCGTLQVSSGLDTSSFEDNVKTVMILLNDEDWRMTEQDSPSVTICDGSFWDAGPDMNHTDPLEQNLWVLLQWNYCTGWMSLMSCHQQHQCSSHLALTCRLDDISHASSQSSAEALSFLAQCTLSLWLGRLLSIFCMSMFTTCLHCFDTVSWVAGMASGL